MIGMRYLTKEKVIKIALNMWVDAVLLAVTYIIATWVINDFVEGITLVDYFILIVTMISVKILFLVLLGLYRVVLSSFSLNDMARLMLSVTLSGIITAFIRVILSPLGWLESFVIFIVFIFLDMVALGSYRISIRIFKELVLISRQGKKTLIIGAGHEGLMMAKKFAQNKDHRAMGFLDDDVSKQGAFIQGIKVLGPLDELDETLKTYDIEEIVIAISKIEASKVSQIVETASTYKIPVKRLPNLEDYKQGSKPVLREINMEDLLDRQVVDLNVHSIGSLIAGSVIMVTGGGGSIGSELCRQVARFYPETLVIVDMYENNAYDIQMELLREFNYKLPFKLEVHIASVYNIERMTDLFEQLKPGIVFHAAAYKHVPLMEDAPNEAIRSNALGTYNIAKLAMEYKVKKMILVSSDKAVRPTNVMGASKRLAERILESMQAQTSSTIFSAVRFGNVLNSNGSVVPLFQSQIKNGGPVTVTSEKVIRYFMTIKEAVGLILESSTFSKPGDIFVLDMGEPVKIIDLAKRLIQLSGYKPYEDIDIKIIGLRPGDKLYEELLISESHKQNKTPHSKIFTEKVNMAPLDFKALETLLERLDHNDPTYLKQVLFDLIEMDVPK